MSEVETCIGCGTFWRLMSRCPLCDQLVCALCAEAPSIEVNGVEYVTCCDAPKTAKAPPHKGLG